MVTGGRTYTQNVGQTADHLRDLADGGMDFTASGNNIIILPDGFCDVVGRLSDADLPEGVTVTEDGASLATRQIVSADTESTIVGTAEPRAGLVSSDHHVGHLPAGEPGPEDRRRAGQ
jgi:hypothetical protein